MGQRNHRSFSRVLIPELHAGVEKALKLATREHRLRMCASASSGPVLAPFEKAVADASAEVERDKLAEALLGQAREVYAARVARERFVEKELRLDAFLEGLVHLPLRSSMEITCTTWKTTPCLLHLILMAPSDTIGTHLWI